jgi:hypothetical protein
MIEYGRMEKVPLWITLNRYYSEYRIPYPRDFPELLDAGDPSVPPTHYVAIYKFAGKSGDKYTYKLYRFCEE